MELFLKQAFKASWYGSLQAANKQAKAPSLRLSCKAACRATQQHCKEALTWLSTKRIHQAVWRCPQPAVHQVVAQHMEATGLRLVPCDLLVPAQQLRVGMLAAWRGVLDALGLPAHCLLGNLPQHSSWHRSTAAVSSLRME